MDTGMLWYDDDKKRTLAEKVQRGADYYAAKYRTRPTVCYINTKTLLLEGERFVNGVTLRPLRTIIPNHFWYGVDEPTTRATETTNEPSVHPIREAVEAEAMLFAAKRRLEVERAQADVILKGKS